MDKRKQLEAELAAAEAECRSANDAFHLATAAVAKTMADWEMSAADRLKAGAGVDALARTVADRQNAYVAKSKAEAEWRKAESMLRGAELEWEQAQDRLDAATAKFDRIVAALDELSALNFGARPSQQQRTWFGQRLEAFGPATSPIAHATKLGARAARDSGRKSLNRSAQWKLTHGFDNRVSARDHNTVHAPARSPLLRQTVGLLCLTLAYLQYYYVDVQLQIVTLPSVTVPSPG